MALTKNGKNFPPFRPKQGANMIKNPEQFLATAGGKIRCRRCKAQSSRTKLQCGKPALKGKAVCGHHGGYSTGPRSKEGKERIRAAHLKHGNETMGAKAERKANTIRLRHLINLGNQINLFDRELKINGRPPSNYVKLDTYNDD